MTNFCTSSTNFHLLLIEKRRLIEIRGTKIIFLESKFMKSVLSDRISHSFLVLLLNNHFHRLVTGSLIQREKNSLATYKQELGIEQNN